MCLSGMLVLWILGRPYSLEVIKFWRLEQFCTVLCNVYYLSS